MPVFIILVTIYSLQFSSNLNKMLSERDKVDKITKLSIV